MEKAHVLKFFADYISSQLGIEYGEVNYYQLDNRLREITGQLGLENVDAFYETAKRGLYGDVKTLLLDTATNNETSFFRNPLMFTDLIKLLKNDPKLNRSGLRIWSAACSTGQEPYSLTMALLDQKDEAFSKGFEIIGTDISERVLKRCKEGSYTQLEIQRGLPAQSLIKYFSKLEDTDTSSGLWQINDDVKSYIQFKKLNLLESFTALGIFDIILCRNVLIYQPDENKKAIISKMYDILRPGGLFILGGSESMLGIFSKFRQESTDRCVFYRKPDAEKIAG